MAEFNVDELLALVGFAQRLEVQALWLAALLYAWAAWRFLRSPDQPVWPQRYRAVPWQMVAAFCLHLAATAVRGLAAGHPPLLTVFEGRSFAGLLAAFVSLVGLRRLGEAPLAGLVASSASASLVVLALLGSSPAAGPLPVALRSPWFQAHRTLVLIGLALAFVALVTRLALRLRPPKLDQVQVRGLTASGDILTDHPHRAETLLAAAVPFLALALAARFHWSGEALGRRFDGGADVCVTVVLLGALVLLLHARPNPADTPVTCDELELSAGWSRLVLGRAGVAPLLGVAAALGLDNLLAPAVLGRPLVGLPGLLGGPWAPVAFVLVGLVPCLLHRGRLAIVDRPLPPSFALLFGSVARRPCTTLEVQNPQLGRADLDDAFTILGFRGFLTQGAGQYEGAGAYGTPTSAYGYLAHLLLLPALLLLPMVVLDGTVVERVVQTGQRLALPGGATPAPGGLVVAQTVATFTEHVTLLYPAGVVDRLLVPLYLNREPFRATFDPTDLAPRTHLTRLRAEGAEGAEGEDATLLVAQNCPLHLAGCSVIQGPPRWDLTLEARPDRAGSAATLLVTAVAGDVLPAGCPGAGWQLAPTVHAGLVTRLLGASELLAEPSLRLLPPPGATAAPVLVGAGSFAAVPGGELRLTAAHPSARLIVAVNPFYDGLELLMFLCGALMLLKAVMPCYLVLYRINPRPETCLLELQIYAAGLASSPSMLIKQLTGHLVIEHESII